MLDTGLQGTQTFNIPHTLPYILLLRLFMLREKSVILITQHRIQTHGQSWVRYSIRWEVLTPWLIKILID